MQNAFMIIIAKRELGKGQIMPDERQIGAADGPIMPAGVIERFKLRPEWSMQALADGSIWLLAERNRFQLRERLYVEAVEAAAGIREWRSLQQRYSPDALEGALEELGKRGILASEAAPGKPHGEGVMAIQVCAVPPLDCADLSHALSQEGLSVAASGGFHVLLASDYLHPAAATMNAERVADGRPWMLVRPAGNWLWAGPLLVPGVTACAECLRIRLMENRWLDGPLFKTGLQLPSPYRPAGPAMASVVLHLAAMEIKRWISMGRSALTGRIWSLNTDSLHVRWHEVRQHPDCQKCGGGHLSCQSSGLVDLDQVVADQTDEETGFLSEVHDFTPDPSWPVRILGVTYVVPVASGFPGEATRPQWAIGRGTSATEARRSAIAEAIERRSLHWHGTEACVSANLTEVQDRALDPAGLLLFSMRQYGTRDEWNERQQDRYHIPRAFDERIPIDWCKVHDIDLRVRLAPAALCYMGYPGPAEWATSADSSGCAAGVTWEEAALAAIYELVEREAAAMWWYHRAARPLVPRTVFRRPELVDIFTYVETRGVQLYLLDLTTDWGIPVCAAALHKDRQTFFAFGCSDDPERAAWQAASEVFQVLLARTQSHRGVGFTLDWNWRLDQEVEPGWRCPESTSRSRLEGHCQRARDFGPRIVLSGLDPVRYGTASSSDTGAWCATAGPTVRTGPTVRSTGAPGLVSRGNGGPVEP